MENLSPMTSPTPVPEETVREKIRELVEEDVRGMSKVNCEYDRFVLGRNHCQVVPRVNSVISTCIDKAIRLMRKEGSSYADAAKRKESREEGSVLLSSEEAEGMKIPSLIPLIHILHEIRIMIIEEWSVQELISMSREGNFPG